MVCSGCGYRGELGELICPVCGRNLRLDGQTAAQAKEKISAARAEGDNRRALSILRLLADSGDIESIREYARILENGRGKDRDIDKAMIYYEQSAKRLDPPSAYGYSRLVSRISDPVSDFWLYMAALLGCTEAYLAAAESYAKKGYDECANYYLYLLAEGGEVDATVQLAQRYYDGVGTERSEEYAKWYMDRLVIPPLYAIKLSYRMRSVKPQLPPEIRLTGKEALYRTLLKMARQLDSGDCVEYLCGLLAEGGDEDAMLELARLYLSGEDKRIDEAIGLLTRAAAQGSAKAAEELGILNLSGDVLIENIPQAIRYFERSVTLGNVRAYEHIGDIYSKKGYTGRDVAYAYKLYRLAEEAGCDSAARKANAIKEARESYYYEATRIAEKSPYDAFRGYYIAMKMGHDKALIRLGECYALGIGVKRDRREGFGYFKLAAERGLAEASLPLGVCYARGIGVRFNFKRATEHLKAALLSGQEAARRELDRLYINKKRRISRSLYAMGMELIYQGKYSAAARVLGVGANFGEAKAIYTLGALYEFGRGVALSRDKARELYSRAAALSFVDERARYKSKILKMLKK